MSTSGRVRACSTGGVEASGNLIDTARGYQDGERVIGRFLRQSGATREPYIASKTEGGKEPGTLDLIAADLRVSLAEFGTDYLETGEVDFVQMVYSVLRQRNERAFEAARRRAVGVVARTALESGLLTGTFGPGHRFRDPDQRARYDPAHLDFVLGEAEKTKSTVVRPPCRHLAEVALRFALLPTGVSAVIVGAEKAGDLRANLAAAVLPPLPEDIVKVLRRDYGEVTERANYF
jgi:aryl-alcohol dehydrogenase-like predicted oxidoreductase